MNAVTREPRTGLPLDRPIPVGELARRLGYEGTVKQKFVLRRIKRLHEAHGGILKRDSPRGHWYVVSLAALQRHWTDVGKRFFAHDDVDEMAEKLATARRELRALQGRVRRLEEANERLVVVVQQLAAASQSG